MHPDDLADLHLAAGDLVEITSPRASVVGVAEPAEDVKRGVISMAHSWGGRSLTDEKVRDIGTPTSRLVSSHVGHDPVTGMVVSSAIPVAVRKAEVPA
jgi:anaerobic selenocysteine-containing dehydrogenase